MTTLRKAAQQALEALGAIDKDFKSHGRQHWPEAVKSRAAITALRAALAEPEPCQYPDCVDNGPDGKCMRWILAECSLSENFHRTKP